MTPRLIILAGPLRGATCPLETKEFYIGRDPSSQLCLDDRLVSRFHALVRVESDRFELNDLESANGTMVNGVPVKRRRLDHCDQIALGNSLLLFLLQEEESAPSASPVQIDDSVVAAGATTLLQPENALYLHVEKVLAAAPHSDRITSDLGALLKISLAINAIRQPSELLRRLLELVLEIIPAQRGAILLVEESTRNANPEYGLSASLDQELGIDQEIQLNRAVVERALWERVAILSDDVSGNDTSHPASGLPASPTGSLLAAPLVAFEQAIGVIYLVTCNPEISFNRDHQELLTAIAGIAAITIQNALRAERMEDELHRRRIETCEMIGESKPMRKLSRLVAKAAPNDVTVLIRGESGTGKELAARAIHRHSPRAGKPFVAINCAALHEGLFESELFGHERGAFTGAIVQKRGLLEAADGGTIFLDEIGELSLALQAKLLRAIQEREFLRVGGVRQVRVNVRVIAATNRDLETMVKDGGFREDLYYRLNVLSMLLPPLRERREDIVLLARYFLKQFSEACKRSVLGFSQPALNCLLHYDWPGNVRELANAIERAVTLCETEFIYPFDLPEAIRELDLPSDAANLHLATAIKETKKRLIIQAIEQARGNLTASAKLLGVDAANLHRLIRDLELKPEVDKLAHSLKVKTDPST